MGGLSYGIYRQSKHKELALSLLARAMQPDIHRDWCTRMSRNPATISGALALDAASDPFLHATAQLFEHARTRWPIPEYVRVSAALGRMFESAILGEADADEAVARAALVISGITGLPEKGAPRRPWTGSVAESRFGD
jgi:ABC-type glycerol-3-phosphate transport system substrate-binding protein